MEKRNHASPQQYQSRQWVVYGIVVVLLGAIMLAVYPAFRQNLRQTILSPTGPVKEELPQITVGKTKVSVEIARAEEEHAKGLADREDLPKDGGMLFVFETPGEYSFWMRGMRFPLDIIWIAGGKVVGFEENLPFTDPQTPNADLPSYLPPQSISAALEVNAGFVQENNIKVDDPVELSNLEPSI